MYENIQIKIAKLYNASQNCISRIKRGLHERGVNMKLPIFSTDKELQEPELVDLMKRKQHIVILQWLKYSECESIEEISFEVLGHDGSSKVYSEWVGKVSNIKGVIRYIKVGMCNLECNYYLAFKSKEELYKP